uniref:Ubiquitin-like domain-containing protein n=1 Tax=Calcidiscus leptoporus TaxID=127549 RepID=A0A7S0IRA6_9EUKA
MADDDDDDDDVEVTRAPSAAAGLGFSLKLPAKSAEPQLDDESEDVALAAAGVCLVHLTIDDGSEKAEQVPMAQTIEFVKARALVLFATQLEGKTTNDLCLLLNGAELLNPMSLSDYSDFQPGKTVRVDCTS